MDYCNTDQYTKKQIAQTILCVQIFFCKRVVNVWNSLPDVSFDFLSVS